MTIAGTSDLIERLITQTMLDAAESIASAQRGKEAAERELEEAKQSMAFKDQLIETLMVKRPLGRKIEQLQQDRDRLAARLDAVEKLADEWETKPTGNSSALTIFAWCAEDLREALSSSPSTSAVAEGEK